MKNELLMRAIGELDDDLIEEAHLPPVRKKHTITIISRYCAIAACFIVILTALLTSHRNNAAFAVSVNGTNVLDTAENPIEISLISPMRQRASVGTEIPVTISSDGKYVTLTAGDGGTILLNDGSEYNELTVSSETEIIWFVDTSKQGTFELTLSSSGTAVKMTASVSYDKNALVVAAQRE